MITLGYIVKSIAYSRRLVSSLIDFTKQYMKMGRIGGGGGDVEI
jgi:hypothetical protein